MTNDDTNVGRRPFMKAAGTVAGAGLLGASAGGAGAAATDDDLAEYLDYRAQEARKVWQRGYRGRIDRPLGLTDSGVDARHPDLGPWNGVRIEAGGDSPTLVKNRFRTMPDEGEVFTGTLGPGAGGQPARAPHAFVPPTGAVRLEVSMSWTPKEVASEDLAIVLERKMDADGDDEEEWVEIDRHGGILTNPQQLGENIVAGEDYRFVAETEANATADYEIEAIYYELTGGGGTETGTKTTYEQVDLAPDDDSKTETFTGTIGPSGPAGPINSDSRHKYVMPSNVDRISATLNWSPATADLDFYLYDSDGNQVASSGNFQPMESFTANVETGEEYVFEVDGFAVVQADYTIEITGESAVTVESDTKVPGVPKETVDDPYAVTAFGDAARRDKVVGWHDAGARYGEPAVPRDQTEAGHGSHVSGIMSGTGRASAIDTDAASAERVDAFLVAGDTVERTVTASAGTGVFASVYGREVDVLIQGPNGRTLDSSKLVGYDSSVLDNNIAQAPTVHDSGVAEYTVIVRPPEGEVFSVAMVDRMAYGPFLDPDSTEADRTDEAPGLRPGLSPNAGIVGFQGLGDGAAAVAKDADYYTETFGLRTVNMSWGPIGGVPFGMAGGSLASSPGLYTDIAKGGILTVAAAGNSYTPANGNATPAVADEVVSVVSTGPLDGIASYSSGGIGAQDEDEGGTYTKPDVTAPGGRAPTYPASLAVPNYDLIVAAQSGKPDRPEDDQTIRDYYGTLGTSMASPYTNGTANLVAEAMEFTPDGTYRRDQGAPDAITLPRPADTGLEDVLRLKQVLLATATETAFTAAPYHEAQSVPKAPTYTHGERDPYEGYGRVNPDAAVDAVTRGLLPAGSANGTSKPPSDAPPTATYSASYDEAVGLDVPRDSRAVAGYVDASEGDFEASIAFSHYGGGNEGMTKGAPHLDLFVYDAGEPAPNGDPNIVASARGAQGDASVTVSVPDGGKTYYVVAKIVNVPGAINGYDVQAHFSLDVGFEAAGLPSLTATGRRSDDGSVFTAGQTNHVTVTATDLGDEVPSHATVRILDHSPWPLTDAGNEGVTREDDGTVDLGTTTAGEIENDEVSRSYFVEAPDETNSYEFGAASLVVEADIGDEYSTDEAAFGGTDTNYVVGVDQNAPSSS